MAACERNISWKDVPLPAPLPLQAEPCSDEIPSWRRQHSIHECTPALQIWDGAGQWLGYQEGPSTELPSQAEEGLSLVQSTPKLWHTGTLCKQYSGRKSKRGLASSLCPAGPAKFISSREAALWLYFQADGHLSPDPGRYHLLPLIFHLPLKVQSTGASGFSDPGPFNFFFLLWKKYLLWC